MFTYPTKMTPLPPHFENARIKGKASEAYSRYIRGYIADEMSKAFGSGEDMIEAYERILKELENGQNDRGA